MRCYGESPFLLHLERAYELRFESDSDESEFEFNRNSRFNAGIAI